MQKEDRVIVYSIPEGASQNTSYKIRVRRIEDLQWKEISCYQVRVDMHDVRMAGMAMFDFEGEVEVEVTAPVMEIYQADIRPLHRNITAKIDRNTIRFVLSDPANLSVEINKDRFHNLHLFAGKISHRIDNHQEMETNEKKNEEKCGEANGIECCLRLKGSNNRPVTIDRETVKKLEAMPKGRELVFEPGLYYIEEAVLRLPSDTKITLCGGAVIYGGFVCEDIENVEITGRGVIDQSMFARFQAIRGIRISHCRNIRIEGITFINPPHYTLLLGGSAGITIQNVKTFSCEGWSDGFDMMSCENVTIDNCFLRTSDDCIAIYGGRWEYHGASRDITIKNSVLWADVAHPTNIGTHGDSEQGGNLIERIHFQNIDILEHHEIQAEYLGCLAINAGDNNMVQNVIYEDIRIEPFEHGKVFDFQVKCNPHYNPAPGKGIKDITLKNITYSGTNPVPSCIKGFDYERQVQNVSIENLQVSGKKIHSAQNNEVEIMDFTEQIVWKP